MHAQPKEICAGINSLCDTHAQSALSCRSEHQGRVRGYIKLETSLECNVYSAARLVEETQDLATGGLPTSLHIAINTQKSQVQGCLGPACACRPFKIRDQHGAGTGDWKVQGAAGHRYKTKHFEVLATYMDLNNYRRWQARLQLAQCTPPCNKGIRARARARPCHVQRVDLFNSISACDQL